MMTYPMHVAGLVRDLPICKVTEDFYIGAFIMFGDAELTVACARDLLKLAEELDYDYLLTAEAKSIPLIHEMARQSGAEKSSRVRAPRSICPTPSPWRTAPSPRSACSSSSSAATTPTSSRVRKF